jgi:hypothetical protein
MMYGMSIMRVSMCLSSGGKCNADVWYLYPNESFPTVSYENSSYPVRHNPNAMYRT